MTLQQKLLAKKSKKGFTLVELVVVIAILAILAAIAVPMVVNIINNAQTSSRESDASTLETACKNYYAAVVAGQISGKDSSAARTVTIADAAAWNGNSDMDTRGFAYNGTHIQYVEGSSMPSGYTSMTLSTATSPAPASGITVKIYDAVGKGTSTSSTP